MDFGMKKILVMLMMLEDVHTKCPKICKSAHFSSVTTARSQLTVLKYVQVHPPLSPALSPKTIFYSPVS